MEIAKYVLIAFSLYMLFLIVVFLVQERIIFQGEEISPDHAYDFGFPYEEVFLKPDSSTTIHGLLMKSEKQAKGVILYFHGNRGDARRWGTVTHELVEYGYDVFVVDYRGYGKSRGERTETLLHQDAKFAYDYLSVSYGKRIIVYGRSLGSGFAVRLAAEREVEQLILETPYYSLIDVAKNYFRVLPMQWLTKFEFRSHLFISKVKAPITIFHGTDDDVVPLASGLRLADSANKRKINFIIINGGKHNNLDTFEVYQSELERILTQKP